MSTRRRRIRRQTVHLGPTPREKAIAAAGAAGVVLFTAFAVWALRPGGPHPRPGHGLTGGIAHRQPKAALLVVLVIVAALALVAYVRNQAALGRTTARGPIVAVGGVIAVFALLAGFFWPGGLLYHWDPPEIPDDIPVDVTTSTIPLLQQTTTPAPTTTPAATTTPGTTAAAPTSAAG